MVPGEKYLCRVDLNIGRTKRSISLDLTKPEAREIVYAIVIGQELRDALGRMGREVVGDDVDLATLGLRATIWPKKATNSSVVWRAAV